MKSRVMYIEDKSDGLRGSARIGRVLFSKSGRTLRYGGRSFRSLKGRGYKANYYDVDTGEEVWISGPKRNGQDTLYPGVIEIDDEVFVEYWRDVRGLDPSNLPQFIRSEGKYSRRNPHPELNVHGSSRNGGNRSAG